MLGAAVRLGIAELAPHDRFDDLEFRLAEQLHERLPDTRGRGDKKRTSATAGRGALARALAQYEAAHAAVTTAMSAFERTGCASAKGAAVGVVRAATSLRDFVIPSEHQGITAVDTVLGTNFRKFCEACERQDLHRIAQKHQLVLAQAKKAMDEAGPMNDSALWHEVVRPVCEVTSRLAQEGREMCSVLPRLHLTRSTTRLDLLRVGVEHQVPMRLENTGDGDAREISLRVRPATAGVEVQVLEPRRSFDLLAKESILVTLGIRLETPVAALDLELTWSSSTISGSEHRDDDRLRVEQQNVQPDWEALANDPPYPVNAIRRREDLFGRDAILQQLGMNAARGTSTFLWGQKRVGKTSVVQVLRADLAPRSGYLPVLFRMGELGALHEGQMAERIASRIAGELEDVDPPRDGAFGAGLGDLIPWVETVLRAERKLRPVVIIDEFDDLDRSFYVGERGRQFMKALRSLSEVGITFFFVGSEKMGAIFERHERELNKWENISLDRIESTQDCRSMITTPLREAIEYSDDAVDAIVAYCDKNPFYIHLLCSTVFQYCFSERRTYVTESDVFKLRERRVQELGATNFSHFWDDNPELDEREADRLAAENCLALACIAQLGGKYSEVDDLISAQNDLDLRPGEQLGGQELQAAADRLRWRGVLRDARGGRLELSLPIFGDWLVRNARSELLDKWRRYLGRLAKSTETTGAATTPMVALSPPHFPISEDDLLDVSQRITYLGKQKDVAELRAWLRQFDDDVRIELAFLLLTRLANQGFINHGTRLQALQSVHEAVNAARMQIGGGAWRVVRRRSSNLCITFVDGPTKSGGTTAREVAQRLSPGKSDAPDRCHGWLVSNQDHDPFLAVVDDFSGTGSQFSTGLRKLLGDLGAVGERYLDEGRVHAYLLYAFPEALDRIAREHPRVRVLAARTLDHRVRAFDEDAGIFNDGDELRFARDVMLQIGRQLQPQRPLGFGDMGALFAFDSAIPNNTLPIFWSAGTVNERPWIPLLPRA
ncbi:MAG: ATP-binding protein [Alphaproteobacteria bacterium]|nr:ATP-binding protein [Alphaproteobacteria bacterium]